MTRPGPCVRYTVHYEWANGRPPPGAASDHRLLAGDLDDAKVEAAITYARLEASTLLRGYRIVAGARRVAYRYPEPGGREAAAV